MPLEKYTDISPMARCFHCWAKLERDNKHCPKCGLNIPAYTITSTIIVFLMILVLSPWLTDQLHFVVNGSPDLGLLVVAMVFGGAIVFPVYWGIAQIFWKVSKRA
jgi:hypothetical protein